MKNWVYTLAHTGYLVCTFLFLLATFPLGFIVMAVYPRSVKEE